MFLISEHPKYCMALIHLLDRPFQPTCAKLIEKRSDYKAAPRLSQADMMGHLPSDLTAGGAIYTFTEVNITGLLGQAADSSSCT